jgi:branched-chain amino acid transport system permease protein
MSGSEFGQQFINALSLGSIYALVAIGLAMVFSILRLINFAHGETLMIGAVASVLLAERGLPWPVWASFAVVITVLSGVLIERIAYRPLRGAPDVTLLLTSLGVSIALQNGALLTFGSQPRAFPTPEPLVGQILLPGQVQISRVNLVTVLTAITLMIVFTWFVTRTQTGVAMRATAENVMAARLMGININTVIVVAFLLGAGLAGVAALLWGARVGRVEYNMGFIPVLKAFVATVIGGFGSIPGAVLGAYILGFGEIFLVSLLPDALTTYRDAFIFSALILILLFRPQGILGSTEAEKI